MPSQLRSLLWKEWHERRIQFLICMIWMVGGTLYCIVHDWSMASRAPVTSFRDTTMLFALFMPLFLAMRTSLGETTDRTRSFSDALPISLQRRGWIRLAGGTGVLIVPILTGAVLLSLCLASGWLHQAILNSPAEMSKRANLSPLSAVGVVWSLTAVVLWAATSLYVLLSLIGTMLRKEVHAGYVGAVVMFLWFMGIFLGPTLEHANLSGYQMLVGAIVPSSMLIRVPRSHVDLLTSIAVLYPLCPLYVNTILQLV
jgi:hypothetical protein